MQRIALLMAIALSLAKCRDRGLKKFDPTNTLRELTPDAKAQKLVKEWTLATQVAAFSPASAVSLPPCFATYRPEP